MVASDLEDEILIRTDRVDSIPFSDPLEDSFVGTVCSALSARGSTP